MQKSVFGDSDTENIKTYRSQMWLNFGNKEIIEN
jgi:hypothetical protein